jgi:hypothetical protein
MKPEACVSSVPLVRKILVTGMSGHWHRGKPSPLSRLRRQQAPVSRSITRLFRFQLAAPGATNLDDNPTATRHRESFGRMLGAPVAV